MPLEDDSVDWVISNCVINLSPDKPRVFAEIARVLKPGGRISVSDIVVQDLPAWIRADPHLYSSCIAGAISEAEYVAGLERAGLRDVQVTERLVYDAAQLAAFVQSELAPETGSSCCGGTSCCSGESAPAALESRVVAEACGKIWSAKFSAVRS
jgi:arsenite methyltransferase